MKNRFLLYLCSAVIAVYAATVNALNPMLGNISDDLSIGLSSAGLLYTACFTGSMCFLLLSGIVTSRFGKQHCVKVLLFLYVFSGYWVSMATGFVSLLIALFFLGGLGSLLQTILYSLPSAFNAEDSTRFLTMLNVFFSIGTVFGLLTIGKAMDLSLSWRMIYVVTASLMLPFAVLFLFRHEGLRNESENIPGNVRFGFSPALFKNRILLFSMFCIFIYVGAETCLTGWFSEYLKGNLSFSASEAGTATALLWGGIGVSRFVYAGLTNRFSPDKLILFAVSSSILTSSAIPFVHGKAFSFLLCILIGFSLSAIWPLIAATGTADQGDQTIAAMSLILVSGSLGASVIPYVIGLIAGGLGLRAAMMVVPFCFAAILILYSIMLKKYSVKSQTNSAQ